MASKKKKKPATHAPRIQNRRARHDYAIEEELEAGIMLEGTEVKSLRAGRGTINEAYASEKNGEIWLINAYIAEYEPGAKFGYYNTRRPRKLLLNKKQIKKLIGAVRVKGYTLVPMSLYFTKRGYAKLKLGLGKGKKEYDKRATEKQRDWNRQKAALMKHNE